MLGNVVAHAQRQRRDPARTVRRPHQRPPRARVLAPAVAVGARGIAMHPAMTFTGTAVDLPRLHGCVFGVTAAAEERAWAERLVSELDGTVMWVAE